MSPSPGVGIAFLSLSHLGLQVGSSNKVGETLKGEKPAEAELVRMCELSQGGQSLHKIFCSLSHCTPP